MFFMWWKPNLYNLNCVTRLYNFGERSRQYYNIQCKPQMGHHRHLLLLFILTSFSIKCQSWSWFSSSAETQFDEKASGSKDNFGLAEFSMEGFNDWKGIKLVENAKKKLVSSNSCWQNAYQHLFAGCSEIFAVDEKRSRFAWHLSDCFQKDSGRPPFPSCDPKSEIAKCLKGLKEYEHKVYLEFYLETNSICHQLQLSIISSHNFNHFFSLSIRTLT